MGLAEPSCIAQLPSCSEPPASQTLVLGGLGCGCEGQDGSTVSASRLFLLQVKSSPHSELQHSEEGIGMLLIPCCSLLQLSASLHGWGRTLKCLCHLCGATPDCFISFYSFLFFLFLWVLIVPPKFPLPLPAIHLALSAVLHIPAYAAKLPCNSKGHRSPTATLPGRKCQ